MLFSSGCHQLWDNDIAGILAQFTQKRMMRCERLGETVKGKSQVLEHLSPIGLLYQPCKGRHVDIEREREGDRDRQRNIKIETDREGKM